MATTPAVVSSKLTELVINSCQEYIHNKESIKCSFTMHVESHTCPAGPMRTLHHYEGVWFISNGVCLVATLTVALERIVQFEE